MDDLGGKPTIFGNIHIHLTYLFGGPLSQETLASKIREFFATHYCPARRGFGTGVPNVRFGGRDPFFGCRDSEFDLLFEFDLPF